jgi:hypothetical protein
VPDVELLLDVLLLFDVPEVPVLVDELAVVVEVELLLDEQATAHARPVNPRTESAKDLVFADMNVSLSASGRGPIDEASPRVARPRGLAESSLPRNQSSDPSAPLVYPKKLRVVAGKTNPWRLAAA